MYLLKVVGMNDVLPKPFTKEGLLAMLEKHLDTLKRGDSALEPMGQSTAQPAQTLIPHIGSGRQSIKEEESPAKSPATTSTWNSPNQIPGVSPVTSSHTDDYMNVVQGHPAAYGLAYTSPQHLHAPQMQIPQGQLQGQLAEQGHRRQHSDISGGVETTGDGKRQQIYAPSMQPLGALQRPR
jgi:osomolarity two-component system response regulator SKN7